ncbi:MAG: DUF4430 domain-containing protein [Clostridia bacterium]|nr:DUF4430 domain-containing protein [Clostridia bacterium]
MKKFSVILVAIIFAVLTLFTVGCGKKPAFVVKDGETCIVITATSTQMPITESTCLLDYMQSLKTTGLLEYEIQNGMITSVNGIENAANFSSCWMLYTSDSAFSNDGWVTVEYDGKTYGSATVGAESLPVKEGCLYIWYYQAF